MASEKSIEKMTMQETFEEVLKIYESCEENKSCQPDGKAERDRAIVARYNEIIEASYASLESQIRKQEEKVELAARLLKKRKKVLKSMQGQRTAVQMKKSLKNAGAKEKKGKQD